jgi:hypothetical protein
VAIGSGPSWWYDPFYLDFSFGRPVRVLPKAAEEREHF